MGLNQGSDDIFLNIHEGEIVKRAKEGEEGAVMRINSKQRQLWEHRYKSVTGKIVGISVRDYNIEGLPARDWNIVINDGTDNYKLQMPYSSGYANGFLMVCKNIDFSKPVEMCPNFKIVDGKKKSTLFVNQNGASLKWSFTKENPNGLPQMVKVKFKGKEQWDDADRMEFLRDMVDNEIVPKLGKADVAKPALAKSAPIPKTEKSKEVKKQIDVDPFNNEEIMDSLPF